MFVIILKGWFDQKFIFSENVLILRPSKMEMSVSSSDLEKCSIASVSVMDALQ